jgi:hypothetical protein
MPLGLFTLMGVLYWSLFRGGWRYLGVVFLLTITVIAALNINGPPLAVLAPGIIVSVLLGWLGYKTPRWTPRKSSAKPILAAFAQPIPTDCVLGSEDVLGQWRFYIDAVGCTVMVDLLAGGRYRQAIVGNSGKRIDCPGGEWTLEGPRLDLTAYRGATRGETRCVRWFFGDCQGDLILFVLDDPQAETMLAALQGEKGNATPSRANKPTRRANSRSPSLFVSSGRPGHGSQTAR